MALEQSGIINVLSKGFNRELTINQLSKSIKKSYAFTNQHAHSLIKAEILTKRAIGSAILCLLNLKNEDTIAHLVFNSISDRKKFMESLPEQKRESLKEFLANLEDKCAFLEKNTITIISEEKAAKLQGYSVITITRSELEKKAKTIDFSNLVILSNHESFWRAISKAV
jgi:transcriptional regulator with PAS, ATPase and Fis domain